MDELGQYQNETDPGLRRLFSLILEIRRVRKEHLKNIRERDEQMASQLEKIDSNLDRNEQDLLRLILQAERRRFRQRSRPIPPGVTHITLPDYPRRKKRPWAAI